jgi:hypothetical protein
MHCRVIGKVLFYLSIVALSRFFSCFSPASVIVEPHDRTQFIQFRKVL